MVFEDTFSGRGVDHEVRADSESGSQKVCDTQDARGWVLGVLGAGEEGEYLEVRRIRWR